MATPAAVARTKKAVAPKKREVRERGGDGLAESCSGGVVEDAVKKE